MFKKYFAAALAVLMLTGCTKAPHTQTIVTTPPVLPAVSDEKDAGSVSEEKESEKPVAVICLDAGHGFADPGCFSDYLIGYESEVTMAITLQLKEKLEQRGAKVILTHDGTDYPAAATLREMAKGTAIDYKEEFLYDNDIFSAYERGVYIALLQEYMEVDFALSLHINSAEDYPHTSRYEFYYCEENPYRYRLDAFADGVAAALDNETRVLPTEYDDSYFVTKYTSGAAMLFEMGYATNQADAANLNDPAWREKLTELLAEQILLQFGENKLPLSEIWK